MSNAATAKSDRLQGKIAVVMGGGSSNPEGGLSNGQAVAIAFARAGATVVVVDIKREAAQVTVDIIEREGGAAFAMAADVSKAPDVERSEEHTSELQSLMRISYAVFCLKKKKQNKLTHYTNTIRLNKH